jgi:hypothetical protein
MRPAQFDTDAGDETSVPGVSDSRAEDADTDAEVQPRWGGSESEITLVFTGETLRPPPSRASDDSIDRLHDRPLALVFARARATDRPPPLAVVVDILTQASTQLVDATRRPSSFAEVPAHGRLSPACIFVSADGLVRIDWSPLEQSSVVTSAPPLEEAYRSPEQLRGLPFDARSDVFSLVLSVCELFVLKRLASDRNKVLAGPGICAKVRRSPAISPG